MDPLTVSEITSSSVSTTCQRKKPAHQAMRFQDVSAIMQVLDCRL